MFSQLSRGVASGAPANTQLNLEESRTLSLRPGPCHGFRLDLPATERRSGLCRVCRAIAEIKMVRARIIKIHRALDETQTEKPDIKIEIPLRIARDRSDVM